MIFEHDDTVSDCGVKIKIIGVGGGGGNAVNRMVAANVQGVEIYALNTDKLAFQKSEVPNKIVIGEKITKGYGAGANPQIGARAAEESIDDIRSVLEGTDMVFITAGMGGGTGTGAAPIVARMAREMDILTIGIVTKPFAFEGKKRMDQAEEGIAELAQYVDSLVVIPNERLKQISSANRTVQTKIVNISSGAGRAVRPYLGSYAATKHAVEAISDAMRRELMRYGIDVIIIEPGPIQTEIWNKNKSKDGVYKYQDTDYAVLFQKIDKGV